VQHEPCHNCCDELHAHFAEQQGNGQIKGMLLAWQQHRRRAFSQWLDTSKAEDAGGAVSQCRFVQ